jgi:hypothetical protein
MTNPIVYVVCQADYDAQGPAAAFTNAEAAEQHAADLRALHSGCDFEVIELPFLGTVPQRASTYLHAGRVCMADGRVEDEQSWTVEHWDYSVPPQPVVSIDERRPEMPRVHVAAASADVAEGAFRAQAAAMIEGRRA